MSAAQSTEVGIRDAQTPAERHDRGTLPQLTQE